MNDDFLYKFRKSPRREFAAALYQRIAKPMKTTARIHTLRYLALTFSLLAIIAGVLFFSPPTRALADGLIRQFGEIIFVQAKDQPTSADNGKGQAGQQATLSPEQKDALQQTKIASPSKASSQTERGKKTPGENNTPPTLDANAVSQLVGFTVLTPAYLPDGYTAVSGGWMVNQDDGGDAAIAQINGKVGLKGVSGGAFKIYVNDAASSLITVEELKVPQGQSRTVNTPNIEDVTVRGQSGAWMPNEHGTSALAWEENGITYMVVGTPISLDEALKVAESLGK